MITYANAKNFKSLRDIEFNLNKTKNKTNNFIAIYGENGSGKTNIVELFKFLQQLTMARVTDVLINKIPIEISKRQEDIEEQLPREIKQLSLLSMNYNEYRMIDEKEPTEIKYGFKIDDKDGFYYIKFNDEVIEEKLYFLAGKQNGYLFEITKQGEKINKSLNKNIFLNEQYNKKLMEIIDMYWGKYSFLSLVFFEIFEKNKDYVFNNITENIIKVIIQIMGMTVHVDKGTVRMISDSLVKEKKLTNIERGYIKKEQIDVLKKCENVLNIFFTQGYADIKEVKYNIIEKRDIINYELYFYILYSKSRSS